MSEKWTALGPGMLDQPMPDWMELYRELLLPGKEGRNATVEWALKEYRGKPFSNRLLGRIVLLEDLHDAGLLLTPAQVKAWEELKVAARDMLTSHDTDGPIAAIADRLERALDAVTDEEAKP